MTKMVKYWQFHVVLFSINLSLSLSLRQRILNACFFMALTSHIYYGIQWILRGICISLQLSLTSLFFEAHFFLPDIVFVLGIPQEVPVQWGRHMNRYLPGGVIQEEFDRTPVVQSHTKEEVVKSGDIAGWGLPFSIRDDYLLKCKEPSRLFERASTTIGWDGRPGKALGTVRTRASATQGMYFTEPNTKWCPCKHIARIPPRTWRWGALTF